MSEKLQKVLAGHGLGSRREMERWIEAGRIKVNGELATLGLRVSAEDKLSVDGRPLKAPAASQQRRRVIMFNKPEGVISTSSDPEGRKTVFASLPRIQDARWIAIGRLDINTSGLMLFTTDGELANKLMHPSTQIEREYLCRVSGEVTDEIIEQLTQGVELEDGMAKFGAIRAQGGRGFNRWYSVVIQEGRNREVRRLWESQGLMVSRLKRVRFGNIPIPSILRLGDWLELPSADVEKLARSTGLKPRRAKPATIKEKQTHQRQLDKLKRRGPRR